MFNHTDFIYVAREYFPKIKWRMEGFPTNADEFEKAITVENLNGDTLPSWDELQPMLTEMKTKYAYLEPRKQAYAQLNQLELIGEDSINGTTNHRDAIIAIKDKYPKE